MNDRKLETKSVFDGGDFQLERVYLVPPTIKDMADKEKSIVIGKVNLDKVPVFLHGIAFRQIIDYFLTRPGVELEGALIGRHCKDTQGREFVEVTDFFLFTTSRARPGSTESSPEEWYGANKRVNEMRRGGSDAQIAGWVHSHPQMRPAPQI